MIYVNVNQNTFSKVPSERAKKKPEGKSDYTLSQKMKTDKQKT